MRVLLTGAGGNLGQSLVPVLLARGHALRTFDLPTELNRRQLAQWQGQASFEARWGDLRDPPAVARAVHGVDAVVHLGAITPPRSELEPEEAREVNVTGMRHLLTAVGAEATPPRILFASSVAVYGRPQASALPGRPKLLSADSPREACDHYSAHKIACEDMLQGSGIAHTILRLGISLPQRPSGGDPRWFGYLFEHALGSRVHFIHPQDAAEALARALELDPARFEPATNRVLCVAGGPGCQLTQRELLTRALEAVGLGMLPENAFGERPLFGDWLDTRESLEVLGDYQRRNLADFAAELRRSVGLKRWGVGLLAPFARNYMLRYSECYQRSRGR